MYHHSPMPKVIKIKPLSRFFLLKRGFCCGNICQNCPYETVAGEKHIKGETRVKKIFEKYKKFIIAFQKSNE